LIAQFPLQHAQRVWMHGTDHLLPQQPLPQYVTLCVASHTARLCGYALHRQGNIRGPVQAVKRGREPVLVQHAARHELGLTRADAGFLFDSMLPEDQARAALKQLATGASEIDWRVVSAS
jgi:hypothetical protein